MASSVTPADVDEMVTQLEVALVAIGNAQGSRVKLEKAEWNLLVHFDQCRKVMMEVIHVSKRQLLMSIFGDDCSRVARIRAVIEGTSFTKQAQREDKRMKACLEACDKIDKTLQDLKLGSTLRQAQAKAKDTIANRQLRAASEEVMAVVQEFGMGVQEPAIVDKEKVGVEDLVDVDKGEIGVPEPLAVDGGGNGVLEFVGGEGVESGDKSAVAESPNAGEVDAAQHEKDDWGEVTPTFGSMKLVVSDGKEGVEGSNETAETFGIDLVALPGAEALTEGEDVDRAGSFSRVRAVTETDEMEEGSVEASEDPEEDRCLPHVLAAMIAETEALELDAAGMGEAATEKFRECEIELGKAIDNAFPEHADDHPKLVEHREDILARIEHLVRVSSKEEALTPTTTTYAEPQIPAKPLHMQAAFAASATARAARKGDSAALATCVALAGGAKFSTLDGGHLLMGVSAKASCPANHILQAFSTPCSDYCCNTCGNAFALGVVMWACRQCDFDMCGSCFNTQVLREQVVSLLKTGELVRLALQLCPEHDVHKTGHLRQDQVRSFVQHVFENLRLLIPSDEQFQDCFATLASGQAHLDVNQCIQLIELLCCKMFNLQGEQCHVQVSLPSPVPTSAPSPVQTPVQNLVQNPVQTPIPTLVQTPVQIVEPHELARDRLARAMQSGEMRTVALASFQTHDVAKTGQLTWNSGGIRCLIIDLCQHFGCPMPTEQQMYATYSMFDSQSAWFLAMCDCAKFAEMLFCRLHNIDLGGQRGTAAQALGSGKLLEVARHMFVIRDPQRTGILRWSTGGIRSFIIDVFQKVGLDCPPDHRICAMYQRFDVMQKQWLDFQQCLGVVDTLCRELYNIANEPALAPCPSGHPMQLFTTPSPGYSCDVCKVRFTTNVVLWSCRPCNFDVCVSCSKKMTLK
eukprot:TRINITY_DN48134_c0_g1_i1.p1 TRINITY_DN48134_c0_g1~~TRINITY_DN48134_c0_g1_i1.p1  ORF type:complete len:916 (-),score=142.11 TRINITY_DN48134_c0_g1_i1:147-2894(-)